jgi:hypothetical protein
MDCPRVVQEIRHRSPKTGQIRKCTKGNVPHIREEMPFGLGVLFDIETKEMSNF